MIVGVCVERERERGEESEGGSTVAVPAQKSSPRAKTWQQYSAAAAHTHAHGGGCKASRASTSHGEGGREWERELERAWRGKLTMQSLNRLRKERGREREGEVEGGNRKGRRIRDDALSQDQHRLCVYE